MFVRHLILALVLAATAFRCVADAENDVEGRLKEAGLEVGYDEAKQRYVAIGTASRELPDLSRALFDKARNDLWKIAALNARRDLMYLLDVRVKAEDSVKAAVKSDLSVNEIRTVIEQFAKMRLSGCKVLCTAESYDESSRVYKVAVAVGWSRKASTTAAETACREWENVDDDAHYVAWCEKNDLSAMLGSRDFTDSDGRRRYVGIGAVDIDGLKELPLARAMKKSEMKAKENLVFAVSVDAAAHDVAQRFVREISDKEVEARQVWERFANEALAECKAVLRNQKEVYATTVRNPVTNRKMYVSVYGVTAAKESEAKGL